MNIKSLTQNMLIADALERIAIVLEIRQASSFRIHAYKKAARQIRELDQSLAELFEEEGREGLVKLPNIGKSIGSAVEEFLLTGTIDTAERMEQKLSPTELFQLVPGIGEQLAKTIVEKLSVSSLEELEIAAHNGQLEQTEGFGSRRSRAVKEYLATILRTSARLRAEKNKKKGSFPSDQAFADPSVETLLAIDAAYRQQDSSGNLRRIAPRRFNPDGKAWLPIMNTERDGWFFTVMYSNTARAHELGKTNDWVVIFYEKGGAQYQCTIVSEWRGGLAGYRVVRGRELECMHHYASHSPQHLVA
ncbi:MAG: DNA-binding protein [Bacteroidota bacterium]